MVRAKEESSRLSRRLHAAERELAELEAKAGAVQQRVEALQREQQALAHGELFLVQVGYVGLAEGYGGSYVQTKSYALRTITCLII